MVWYLNKRANFYFFSLCARSLHSLALLTPRHSWMTHSRMNQPSQIQPKLFLACPLRSFGVCLHSPRMLKHRCCCGSWDWHGQSKLEGRMEERGKKGQRYGAMDWWGIIQEVIWSKLWNAWNSCKAISTLSLKVVGLCGLMVLPHSYPRCKVNVATMMDFSNHLSPFNDSGRNIFTQFTIGCDVLHPCHLKRFILRAIFELTVYYSNVSINPKHSCHSWWHSLLVLHRITYTWLRLWYLHSEQLPIRDRQGVTCEVVGGCSQWSAIMPGILASDLLSSALSQFIFLKNRTFQVDLNILNVTFRCMKQNAVHIYIGCIYATALCETDSFW